MIFICDVMLGKLARYLRVLGLDAPYIGQGHDRAKSFHLVNDALFLTKRKVATGFDRTIIIKSNNPREQIIEIKKDIEPYIDVSLIMTRCIDCNTRLIDSLKIDVEPFVPEYVFHHYSNFKTCPACKKIYWEGSHADEMHEWVKNFIRHSAEISGQDC